MNRKIALAVAYFAPFVVFAVHNFAPHPPQTSQGSMNILGIIAEFNSIFTLLTGVLVTIGLLYFLYGVTKYVANQGDEQGRTEARQMMINGIIALFVMVSVWGLVQVLITTFGVSQTSVPLVPPIVR